MHAIVHAPLKVVQIIQLLTLPLHYSVQVCIYIYIQNGAIVLVLLTTWFTPTE